MFLLMTTRCSNLCLQTVPGIIHFIFITPSWRWANQPSYFLINQINFNGDTLKYFCVPKLAAWAVLHFNKCCIFYRLKNRNLYGVVIRIDLKMKWRLIFAVVYAVMCNCVKKPESLYAIAYNCVHNCEDQS